ncbi:MAG: BACON domain-containing protein, partial [Bacteroidales bacterium]
MKTIITLCKGTNILCNSFGVKKILLVVIFFIPIIFNASGQNVQSTSVYPNIARTINKLSFVYSYEDGELKVGWRGLTWGANRSYLTFTKPSLPTGSIIDRIELKLHLKGGSTSSSHVTKICKLNYHSSNSPKDYYDEMNNSTQYASGSWLGIPTSNPVTIDLIPGAVTDYLNSSLNFYIGIKEDGDDDSYGSIYGINEDDFYYPSLLIYYIVPYVNVDKTSLTLGQGINSVNSLQIISNTSWNASVNVPWISINPSSGSNDNTIEIKATSENQSSTPRNAILTITGTNATTKTVSITQEGITLQCSPLSLELESTEGSNKQVNIASNYTWEASSNVMWLFPEPLNSTGNGSITINAAFTNPSIDPRTGLITVKSGDLTKTITVTQKGSAPILTVTPANLTFESPSGSNGDFTITSNTRWTVTDDASWLTLSSASGSGNGTLTVTVSSANTATNTRTANVTFSASSVSPVVVTVTQSGTSSQLVVTPSNQNVSSSSGTTSFAVESNISWTAS